MKQHTHKAHAHGELSMDRNLRYVTGSSLLRMPTPATRQQVLDVMLPVLHVSFLTSQRYS